MSQQLLEMQSVVDLLRTSSNPELRRLSVRESDEEIRLTGRVSSFYLKQLAQESVRPVAEGRRIINQVEVMLRA